MPKILTQYKNGNYHVKLYDDGTKIKYSRDDCFHADFPDSIDLKITDYCENNCPMCHESSSISGRHGLLTHPIVDSFVSGMEVAIGGGNPLTHPDLVDFLKKLKDNKIIANITINERELKRDALIESLISDGLVHGVGLSCMRYSDTAVKFAQKHSNVVLHVINGVFPLDDFKKLYDSDLKILILGYKRFGKGNDYYDESVQRRLSDTRVALGEILPRFKVVSFDNLALDQLEVKKLVRDQRFNESYMGDDGEASMYIDLVKQQFARSSTSTERYPINGSLIDCFNLIRK